MLAEPRPRRLRLAVLVAFTSWISTLICIIPLCYIACRMVHRESGHAAAARLQMARDIKRAQILAWYEQQFISLSQLASGSEARSMVLQLQAWGKSQGVKPSANFPVKDPGYEGIRKHDAALRNFVNMGNYRDLFLIDANTGQVLYTTENDIDNGINLNQEQYSKTELAKCWRHCRTATAKRVKDQLYLSDYCVYPPGYQATNLFIGIPLWHERPPKAVIALQLDPSEINDILCNGRGLGKWGEAYLCGEDLRVRTRSRLQSQYWKRAGKPNPMAAEQPSKLALEYNWSYRSESRQRGVMRSTTLYNKPSLAAFSRLFPNYTEFTANYANEFGSLWSRPSEIRTPRLALIVEQPLSEAYAPARALTALLIVISLGVLALTWQVHRALGRLVERRARPQNELEGD